MKKSRLARILTSFSLKDHRDFRKWVHSPAHNQREDVVRLYEYLADDDRLYSDEDLTKEQVFPHVYENETFDDARMRQCMHFLLKCVEEFLTWSELVQDPVRSRIALASVFRRRHLDKSFEKILNKVRKDQKRSKLRNRRFLENEHLLEMEHYYYLSSKQRTGMFNLQEVSDTLDHFYLAEKLRQASLMVSHQAVYNIDYDWGLLDGIIDLIQQKDYLQYPAIAVYYYSYLSLRDRENDDYFYQLKEQIKKYSDVFPRFEIRDHYLLAINFCIRRVNRGEKQFAREALEIIQLGLEKETLLLEDGIISRWSFRNAVSLGTLLKEFTWTERFIKDYKDHLEEKYRDSIVHYSMARLHYEKKEYAEAMRLFTQVEYDDMLMNLTAKAMLLKMYYEQDEFNALESLLESMRVYLRRKKVIGYHRDNYTNIITYTKKLTTVNPYERRELEKLRSEVEASTPNTEKRWLLEQVQRLQE